MCVPTVIYARLTGFLDNAQLSSPIVLSAEPAAFVKVVMCEFRASVDWCDTFNVSS